MKEIEPIEGDILDGQIIKPGEFVPNSNNWEDYIKNPLDYTNNTPAPPVAKETIDVGGKYVSFPITVERETTTMEDIFKLQEEYRRQERLMKIARYNMSFPPSSFRDLKGV